MPTFCVWNVWYGGRFKSSNRVSEPLPVINKRGFSMDNEQLRGLCKCKRFSVDDVKPERPRKASLCLRPPVVRLFERRVFNMLSINGFSLCDKLFEREKKQQQQLILWYFSMDCAQKHFKIMNLSYFVVNWQVFCNFWCIGWSELKSWYSG